MAQAMGENIGTHCSLIQNQIFNQHWIFWTVAFDFIQRYAILSFVWRNRSRLCGSTTWKGLSKRKTEEAGLIPGFFLFGFFGIPKMPKKLRGLGQRPSYSNLLFATFIRYLFHILSY